MATSIGHRVYRLPCAGASSRNVGVAIDLIASAPQAGHAIAVYVALPGQELIDRDVVDAARLLDRHPAAAHGLDHGRLPPCCPALAGDGSSGSGPRTSRQSSLAGSSFRVSGSMCFSLPLQPNTGGNHQREKPDRYSQCEQQRDLVWRRAVHDQTIARKY